MTFYTLIDKSPGGPAAYPRRYVYNIYAGVKECVTILIGIPIRQK